MERVGVCDVFNHVIGTKPGRIQTSESEDEETRLFFFCLQQTSVRVM